MTGNAIPKMSPQDESTWFKVRIALKVEPQTEGFYKDVKITVNRGTVTLEGTAPSKEAVLAAERAAMGVQDVMQVINNLKTA